MLSIFLGIFALSVIGMAIVVGRHVSEMMLVDTRGIVHGEGRAIARVSAAVSTAETYFHDRIIPATFRFLDWLFIEIEKGAGFFARFVRRIRLRIRERAPMNAQASPYLSQLVHWKQGKGEVPVKSPSAKKEDVSADANQIKKI